MCLDFYTATSVVQQDLSGEKSQFTVYMCVFSNQAFFETILSGSFPQRLLLSLLFPKSSVHPGVKWKIFSSYCVLV